MYKCKWGRLSSHSSLLKVSKNMVGQRPSSSSSSSSRGTHTLSEHRVDCGSDSLFATGTYGSVRCSMARIRRGQSKQGAAQGFPLVHDRLHAHFCGPQMHSQECEVQQRSDGRGDGALDALGWQ